MTQQSRAVRPIQAAGAVVTRKGREVLLVHRPKYDDWSFPKGKADPGEHVGATAVREVAEETGLDIRLGPALSPQQYRVNGRPKVVHYWMGRVLGSDDVSGYRPNAEIDRVGWFSVEEARERLSYPYDRDTLRESLSQRRKTRALVVLRHGRARSRRSFAGSDPLRPLVVRGHHQAQALVPLLAAYGVTDVVSSSSVRCLQTVQPYADVAGQQIRALEELSEELVDGPRIEQLVADLFASGSDTVLCTHRPVLPLVWKAAGVEEAPLEPGEMCVLHHRKGRIVGLERLTP